MEKSKNNTVLILLVVLFLFVIVGFLLFRNENKNNEESFILENQENQEEFVFEWLPMENKEEITSYETSVPEGYDCTDNFLESYISDVAECFPTDRDDYAIMIEFDLREASVDFEDHIISRGIEMSSDCSEYVDADLDFDAQYYTCVYEDEQGDSGVAVGVYRDFGGESFRWFEAYLIIEDKQEDENYIQILENFLDDSLKIVWSVQ